MKSNQYQEERASKRQTWKRHLDEWQSSNSKVADFCKSHDLQYHQFKYWQEIFSKEQRKPEVSDNHQCGFIELKSLETFSDLEPKIAAASTNQLKPTISKEISISTPNAYHIHLHQDIDLETLTILLKTLKAF